MEVLQTSGGSDGPWPTVREGAAPSKVLRRRRAQPFSGVLRGAEASCRHRGGESSSHGML